MDGKQKNNTSVHKTGRFHGRETENDTSVHKTGRFRGRAQIKDYGKEKL